MVYRTPRPQRGRRWRCGRAGRRRPRPPAPGRRIRIADGARPRSIGIPDHRGAGRRRARARPGGGRRRRRRDPPTSLAWSAARAFAPGERRHPEGVASRTASRSPGQPPDGPPSLTRRPLGAGTRWSRPGAGSWRVADWLAVLLVVRAGAGGPSISVADEGAAAVIGILDHRGVGVVDVDRQAVRAVAGARGSSCR
jgi:hypothetical protein